VNHPVVVLAETEGELDENGLGAAVPEALDDGEDLQDTLSSRTDVAAGVLSAIASSRTCS
jgi:hypothetical protein